MNNIIKNILYRLFSLVIGYPVAIVMFVVMIMLTAVMLLVIAIGLPFVIIFGDFEINNDNLSWKNNDNNSL